MMSGHGANLVFFNKKNKAWTSRTLTNPPPPMSDNISLLPNPRHDAYKGVCISHKCL